MIHPPKQGESQIGTQGNPLRFRFLAGRFRASSFVGTVLNGVSHVDRLRRIYSHAVRKANWAHL